MNSHLKANDRRSLAEQPINDALVPAQPVSPVLALPTTLILYIHQQQKTQIRKTKI